MSPIFLPLHFFLFLFHLPTSEEFFKVPKETSNATKASFNELGNATTETPKSTLALKTTLQEETGRVCAKHGKPKTTSLCKTTPNFCDFYKSGESAKISVRIVAENRNGLVCAEGKLTRTCSTGGKVCHECAAGPIRNKIRGKFVCDMYSAGDRVCKLKSEDGVVCKKVRKWHTTVAPKSTVAPMTTTARKLRHRLNFHLNSTELFKSMGFPLPPTPYNESNRVSPGGPDPAHH